MFFPSMRIYDILEIAYFYLKRLKVIFCIDVTIKLLAVTSHTLYKIHFFSKSNISDQETSHSCFSCRALTNIIIYNCIILYNYIQKCIKKY